MSDPYPSLEKLERKVYEPYGKCIYCDSTEDLRTEHIVAFGLGGNLELPKSSCGECADKTSRTELTILRGELRPVRVFRAIQSRSKHKSAPSTYPLAIVRNGSDEIVELPPERYPILVPFPEFPPARLAVGEPSRPGIDVSGVITISFGPDPRDILKELGATTIRPYVTTSPPQFALMVAKIAYSMAAATGALSLLRGASPIRDVILGKNTCIGDYVGTLTYPLSSQEGMLHRVAVMPDVKTGQLVADVQLFSDSDTPRYGVLLGELRDGAS